jgi:hypothetical protein
MIFSAEQVLLKLRKEPHIFGSFLPRKKLRVNFGKQTEWATIWAIFSKLIWGGCYDHDFLQFSTIFAEKIGVFLKNRCYDHNFA